MRMKRLLEAIYHPRNEYIVHLDLEAPFRERVELARFVNLHPTFARVGNVHMVAKSNLVTYKGPTMLSTYLHCMAILLKQRKDWDWFINLSASDYPLVTQDGEDDDDEDDDDDDDDEDDDDGDDKDEGDDDDEDEDDDEGDEDDEIIFEANDDEGAEE